MVVGGSAEALTGVEIDEIDEERVAVGVVVVEEDDDDEEEEEEEEGVVVSGDDDVDEADKDFFSLCFSSNVSASSKGKISEIPNM